MTARHALRLLALVAASVGAGAAHAVAVDYQCTGYRPLSADFTPRVGQVNFEGHHWTVRRVRAGGEAHYVDAANGISVTAKVRGMVFTHGAETLQCILKSDALTPVKPPSAASR